MGSTRISSVGRSIAARRLLTFAFAIAASAASAVPADAATPLVIFKAYDSKGKDTGKCLRGPDSYAEGQGGYRLVNCDKNAKSQRFYFDTNVGGTIAQAFGATATSDGQALLLAVINGSADQSWYVNAPLGRVASSSADNYGAAGKIWRWVGTKISNVDMDSRYCLTTTPSSGNEIRLGLCAKPETLIQWDVKVVN